MVAARAQHSHSPVDQPIARLTRIRELEPEITRSTRRRWLAAPVRSSDFRDSAQAVPVSVTGTHGGAGTTTVARLLHATDLGYHWPDPEDGSPPRVLLVARTHAAGLMAASQALAGYHATRHPEGPYLAGFVLVSDAPGRLPKPLRRRITILTSASMVYRLPWVSAWRLSETAHDEAIGADLRRFAERAALAITPAMHEHEGESPCNA
jgi:hypothetical protein